MHNRRKVLDMIYDKLENISTYLGIHPELDVAIKEIQKGAYINWDLGRHEIDRDNVFCNSVEIELSAEKSWERHKRYLDIHINLDGTEQIRCADICDVRNWTAFDNQNDYAIAPFSTEGICCPMRKGWFLVVFPQDAHMPGIKYGAEKGRKVIFKILYSK